MFVKVLSLVLLFSLPFISTMKTIPSKEDCIALWNAVGGAGGDLKNVATKSGVAMDGVLKLYEDCLRSEEGIRYRRNYWSKSFKNVKDSNDFSEIISKLLNDK